MGDPCAGGARVPQCLSRGSKEFRPHRELQPGGPQAPHPLTAEGGQSPVGAKGTTLLLLPWWCTPGPQVAQRAALVGRQRRLSPASPALEDTVLHPWAPRRECWLRLELEGWQYFCPELPRGAAAKGLLKRLRRRFWTGVGLAQGWWGPVCTSLGTCGWVASGASPTCPLPVVCESPCG